jgi:hypothetical protein
MDWRREALWIIRLIYHEKETGALRISRYLVFVVLRWRANSAASGEDGQSASDYITVRIDSALEFDPRRVKVGHRSLL